MESRKRRSGPESLLINHASSFEIGIVSGFERGGSASEKAVFFSRQKGDFVETADHDLHVVRAHILGRHALFEGPRRIFGHNVGQVVAQADQRVFLKKSLKFPILGKM